eukprot:scaffold51466_cov34-Prasinocladus_malaysianus.AAC.1
MEWHPFIRREQKAHCKRSRSTVRRSAVSGPAVRGQSSLLFSRSLDGRAKHRYGWNEYTYEWTSANTHKHLRGQADRLTNSDSKATQVATSPTVFFTTSHNIT